jgi:serine/threonine protein kinase
MLRPASLLTREITSDGRVVMLKQLRPEESGRADLALRLANEAAVLRHLAGTPGVIELLEIRRNPLTLVLAFANGGSLMERLDAPLPIAERRRIAGELLAAVAACHARGVVHRDIKPSNILFEAGALRLADFGVAAWGEPRRALPEGWEEDAVGTPPWSPPELRVNATGQVATSIDIYGLGKTLAALLGDSSPAIMAACHDDPRQRPTLAELGRSFA